MKKLTLTIPIGPDNLLTACEILSRHSGISRQRIKTAMTCGAVWLKHTAGKQQRLRRASAIPKKGDRLGLYYDEALLAISPPVPECISDQRNYSVWFKPAGLLTQGTLFGDHCCLIRRAEIQLNYKRKVFPIHRLDREASGLVLIAHSRDAAAKLSGLFQKQLVKKHYQIIVPGNLAENHPSGTIDRPLDGRQAVTEFECVDYDPVHDRSTVRVRIMTGRLHQIRRHFDMIGFPVLGDPKYGKGNKNAEGMKLMAISLAFVCPYSHQSVEFKLNNI
ncbi:MAG: RluA family pseudouridine synthase [Desulfobacterales bacterium]|nr:RluA family pseudouridine synthase [Desulfobacterales bacterium]MDD4072163.1 RluA family pseudouridine synthase [Desulfobacterales bacterium]MDD4394202.1 RluA family pseudouridine synthase [Desulfobacterales bacterium]